MKLIIESKYPHPFKEKKHKGASDIIYETGQRTTDISKLKEKFDDFVEENEGKADDEEADAWSSEVPLDNQRNHFNFRPVTEGTDPTPYNFDKKLYSSVESFQPSAAEVLTMASTIRDEAVQEQLVSMVFMDDSWLEELLEDDK